VVTKDRIGTHESTTPPTQWLSAANRTWHLVQTNDDLLSPPDDRRRNAALTRLAKSNQAAVDMDFVQKEMQTPPITNSDTILTWVGNPSTGVRRILIRPQKDIAAGMLSKKMHRMMHMAMPQDFKPKEDQPIVLAKTVKPHSLRGNQ